MSDKPTMLRDLAPITGFELFQWPEWRALLDRLGIPVDQRTQRIVIDSGGIDDLVQVVHHHNAVDASEERRAVLDTSNLHNERWTTKIPNPRKEEVSNNPFIRLEKEEEARRNTIREGLKERF